MFHQPPYIAQLDPLKLQDAALAAAGYRRGLGRYIATSMTTMTTTATTTMTMFMATTMTIAIATAMAMTRATRMARMADRDGDDDDDSR